MFRIGFNEVNNFSLFNEVNNLPPFCRTMPLILSPVRMLLNSNMVVINEIMDLMRAYQLYNRSSADAIRLLQVIYKLKPKFEYFN